MKSIISRICCRLRGHHWTSRRLGVTSFGLGIRKDCARRSCTCCGAREMDILGYR